MPITIEYRGWEFEFDHVPSDEELEERYEQKLEQMQAESESDRPVGAEQGVLEGAAPLSPIQRWFFDQEFVDPSHWNHGIVWTPSGSTDPSVWERAWEQVLQQHDALRLRYPIEEGERRQHYAGWEPPAPFETVEAEGDLEEEVDRVVASTHRSLDLEEGPIARMVYLQGETDEEDRLVLVVHHLAISGYSWTILAGDLQQLVAQMAAGADPSLPDKTTSYRAWSQQIEQWPIASEDVSYWLNERFDEADYRVPIDTSAGRESNVKASASTVRTEIDAEVSAEVVEHGDEEVLLVAALARVLWDWLETATVAIEAEGNSRDRRFGEPDMDLSRTVGWFTAFYPYVLSKPEGDEPEQVVEQVARQLEEIPECTVAHMIARQRPGEAEWQQRLAARPTPDVLFDNYGYLEGAAAQNAVEGMDEMRSPDNQRTHVLEVYAYRDEDHIRCNWIYSSELHADETIEGLAAEFGAELEALISGVN